MDVRFLIITPDLLRYISEIDEFKGSWSAQSGLNSERLQALRRVATIESIGSSTRIEGSKLSNADTENLLSQVGKLLFRQEMKRKSLDMLKPWKPCLKILAIFQSLKTISNSCTAYFLDTPKKLTGCRG